MNKNRRELLIKIAFLHYKDELSQSEIANVVGISRSQVSRLLEKAKQEGIVYFNIVDSNVSAFELEKQLIRRYGLRDCVVVDDASTNEEEFYERLGFATGEILKRYIRDEDVVAVSSGKTLFHVSEHIPNINKKALSLVPTSGSIGPKNARWQPITIINKLADEWNSASFLLSAPSIVSSPDMKKLLLKEPEISEIYEKAKNANVVICGIGHLKDDSATLYQTGYLDESDMNELKSLDAVSTCCGSLLNKDGNSVNFSGDDKTLSIKLDEFSKKTNIIAISYGKEKIDAIYSALLSKCINILITNKSVAKMLIENKKPTYNE